MTGTTKHSERRRSGGWTTIGWSLLVIAVTSACGDAEPPNSGPGDATPVPAEMCPTGSSPVVAAYDQETGAHQWAACAPGLGLYLVEAASADTVYVGAYDSASQQESFIAYDASSGAELWRGDRARYEGEVDPAADVVMREPPIVDGVRLGGGQDDPLTGTSSTTGAVIWTQQAFLVYDDVWAVGDGAVFAVERGTTGNVLAGYEISSGEPRWQTELTAYLWPWHVITDDRLLVMWTNLQVVATDDGDVLWETRYPEPPSGFPRMMGGVANDRSVFVSFTSQPSGGD